VFLEHDVNHISNGNHPRHGTTVPIDDWNMPEILLDHELHDIKNAVLWGDSDQRLRRGHNFGNFGIAAVPSLDYDLGKIITLGEDADDSVLGVRFGAAVLDADLGRIKNKETPDIRVGHLQAATEAGKKS